MQTVSGELADNIPNADTFGLQTFGDFYYQQFTTAGNLFLELSNAPYTRPVSSYHPLDAGFAKHLALIPADPSATPPQPALQLEAECVALE